MQQQAMSETEYPKVSTLRKDEHRKCKTAERRKRQLTWRVSFLCDFKIEQLAFGQTQIWRGAFQNSRL